MRSIRDEYDGGEWMDASTVGSPFEVQLNQRTGQWRHRPMTSPHLQAQGIMMETSWVSGSPQKGSTHG